MKPRSREDSLLILVGTFLKLCSVLEVMATKIAVCCISVSGSVGALNEYLLDQ